MDDSGGQVNIEANKIVEGENVDIEIVGYPKQKYGVIKGKILEKTNVFVNDEMLVRITLINGLTTNMGKSIEYIDSMKGKVSIEVNSESLFKSIQLR